MTQQSAADSREQIMEKWRRIYYQDIVYKICNEIDRLQGGKIVCGTFENPSKNVQETVSKLLSELAEKRRSER